MCVILPGLQHLAPDGVNASIIYTEVCQLIPVPNKVIGLMQPLVYHVFWLQPGAVCSGLILLRPLANDVFPAHLISQLEDEVAVFFTILELGLTPGDEICPGRFHDMQTAVVVDQTFGDLCSTKLMQFSQSGPQGCVAQVTNVQRLICVGRNILDEFLRIQDSWYQSALLG